jgi:hypothetical protein
MCNEKGLGVHNFTLHKNCFVHENIIAMERTPQEKAVAKMQRHIYTEMVRTLSKNFNLLSSMNQSLYTNNIRKNALECLL